MFSLGLRWFSCLLVVVSLMGCLLGCKDDRVSDEVWIQRGRAQLQPFKGKLMSALAEGLQDGPEGAIEVCQHLAPAIANEMRTSAVEVGRTSHKLRNKQNVPRDWVKPLLNEYVATPGQADPKIVHLAGGGIGYVEPIYLKSMCLACHGRSLAPAVAARIDAQYPEDEARDFATGDFRGLFWVEFNN
ncbi:MAG: DUF3365 domain-containing protein [Desulfuromonadaceae bacterium]